MVAGCGGQSAPGPSDIVQSYQSDLAEGNYGGACGYLVPAARSALARRLGPRATCAQAMARCLPNRALIPKQDQSQLLFANVLASVRGSHASARLSGNPVANAIREVSLVDKRGKGWTLTSYGHAFTACHKHRGKRR